MQVHAIAVAGLMTAQARFDTSARRTVAAPLDDLAGETVERISSKAAFSVNAAVLRTVDEMSGALLDILA